ncbi:secondary thiamine-phosphate synthase [Rhizobium sp. Root274]|uniref:secondary thiamine-phosphate synthase enzyme YjbQ n=1 Tax=unclassified Rhizobium TaxID=2613769 RepID=UPI000715E563|nr:MULTISPECIES: secondary thiamine-phosphate synthase enzyme YjbQ [unclassified Rhizobium]KQW28906.1 secondary thiamine-phosphate synthase [Rhizobium sp. Root1240]KRD29102.1 secondary thiamine-phosphate synthase [Rhizobium sp. Root274]
MAQRRITIDTRGPGLYEFTKHAEDFVGQAAGEDGVLTVFVRHTSCSLLIQENADPSVKVDLQAFFRRLVPPANDPSMSYIIHRDEGPDDMPAHIKAALLPVSLGIPYADGRLLLGTWQGLYLVEHRDRPHRREIILSF